MADIEVKQFKLTDEGVIFFQQDPTNPLPGKKVGRITKGKAMLTPVAIAEGSEFDNTKLTEYLHAYINYVLEPLALLCDEEKIPEPARQITEKLYEALGILPRVDLEEPIAALEEEGRNALRARKVRLGPVLVFLPLLNKPAAVRLRALLWNLWNDKPLPADVPQDGVTSVMVVDPEKADPLYYRSIGYPLYGPRAIRVDMLDRLISAVYDSADNGIFKALHDMAEWLGCPIADLYSVLEAMGHKKIHDPADEQKEEEVAAKTQEDNKVEEPKAEAPEEKAEGQTPPELQVKPELATFRLRKGKAYGTQERKKPYFKAQKKEAPKKPKKPIKKQRPDPKERVISAAAPKKKLEESPFAVLKDLKVQNKD